MPPVANPAYSSLPTFHARLRSAHRILALCGAGLSAASGLPTFRGAGGYWRNHEATALATPEAFAADPGLVWLFYAYRRHMALKAVPNAGHRALAALAERAEGVGVDFLCLSQNVDGLHARAGHGEGGGLRLLHGSLFDLKCDSCEWMEKGNYDDPLCESLRAASEEGGLEALLDPGRELRRIEREELPRCPRCETGVKRPGVVWFGERLDAEMLRGVDEWIGEGEVDVVLVIGTSAVVHPAASYVYDARGPGTSIVTVNLDAEEPENLEELGPRDFAFAGDAAELLPRLLEPIIGRIREDGTFGGEE
ncbi:DHS-like NAD/FAD-binding domain-containing protein [Coniochaeta ligniaria NRRL 30616]|uniref:DHS-like NAD/FAD-binding domain-containing protein n=1 Tax=Coniochaeta ligniaria NRRL 30616 TaxID=1408157 RepID=A0A1J7J6R0_9PEZI|nr:DHS-like NAD/FAD-binding domain-containing protein [Coniochaeta ligniaria NRRL 30616]